MRIISKFKDYYDSVQAYGQDSRLVYVRKKEEFIVDKDSPSGIIIDKIFQVIPNSPDINFTRYQGDTGKIIGFCGNLYPVWKLKRFFKDDHAYFNGRDTYVYNCVEAEQILRKSKNYSTALEGFLNNKTSSYYHTFNKTSITKTIAQVNNSRKQLEYIFYDYKVPCFLIEWRNEYVGVKYERGYKITLNPILKDLRFYKNKDAFTAYQDISMYLSGVLGLNDPETVSISDEDMKDQKGFGHKYAFKKEPSKRL